MTATANDSRKNRCLDEIGGLVGALAGGDELGRSCARGQIVEFGSVVLPFLIGPPPGSERQSGWGVPKALGENADPTAADTLVPTLGHRGPVASWNGAQWDPCGRHDVVPGNVTASRLGSAPKTTQPVAACQAPSALNTRMSNEYPQAESKLTREPRRKRISLKTDSRRAILFAEDDEEMRRLLGMLLSREGYRVVQCRDGVELLDHLGSSVLHEEPKGSFDLIISDVRMPGATGLSVLEGIAGREGFPPVILITAFGDPEIHARARRAGVVALFDKPFNTDDLLSTVRELLSSTREPK